MLLECLAYVTRHYGRAKSPQAIIAGLPYAESGMGPRLFCEAAEKLGYRTKAVKRGLSDIEAAVLPAVLLMEGNGAVVLLDIDRKGNAWRVFDPAKNTEETLESAVLSARYSGHALFVHPDPDVLLRMESAFEGKSGAHYPSHWFWGELWNNRALYSKVLWASALINLFALVSPLFIMNVYDRVIPNNAMETGWVLGIGAITVFLFDFVIRTLRGYFIDMAGRKIDVVVGRRIFDQVMDMKLSRRPGSSGMFASMLKEFDAVKDFFTSATMTGFVDLPFSLLFIFAIFLLAGPVGLILLFLMAIVGVVGVFLQMPLRYLIAKSLKAAEAKHGLLVEAITGLETIKAIRADGKIRARYGEYIAEAAAVGQHSRFFSALGINVAMFFQQAAAIFIVLFGMYMVREGELSVGALIATVILSGRAIAPMTQIAGLLTRYHQSFSSLRTIARLMEAPVERPANKRFLHRPQLAGKITFDKVGFAYPSADPKEARKVLDGVSFTIQPGEKVGLIGRIGSGKSTIARLMMGLYDPADGTILIDDTDYRQIDPADLRRNVGYIAQDVVLFSGTVRDNITMSDPKAREEDILRAAQLSGAHEFISRHPHGYDAMVGERGEGLSGGQRQAIALARAILARPSVFVCDEPTNAMDSQAEEAFARHIDDYAKDKTLVLITHRQSLLRIVDRLILIDQGRVLADGPRDKVIEVLARSAAEAMGGGAVKKEPRAGARMQVGSAGVMITGAAKPEDDV